MIHQQLFEAAPAGSRVAAFNRSTGVWSYVKLGDAAGVKSDKLSGSAQPGEIPVAGRFSGGNIGADPCDDIGVFNTRTAEWRIKSCEKGDESSTAFGDVNSIPVPGDIDGDKIDDYVTFNPRNSTWKILPSLNPNNPLELSFGLPGDIPLLGDLNGDGLEDLIVFRQFQAGFSFSLFIIRLSQLTPGTNPQEINFSGDDLIFPWGVPGDLPGACGSFWVMESLISLFFVQRRQISTFALLSLSIF